MRSVRDAYYSGLGPLTDLMSSAFGIGWHHDAGIQFVRMVLAGVFDRFPDLQIILGHWGEVVLFYVERMAPLSGAAGLERPLTDYFRRNLYVTRSGVFSQTYLKWTLNVVGIDRILFSTDYPYQYHPGGEAKKFVDVTGLSADDRAKLAYANWERLTGGAA